MLHIALEGAYNFRDIGGYATTDGHAIKTGVLYRSDELCHLTDADIERLAELGLSTVIDYRADHERDARPDRVPAGCTIIQLDPQADTAAMAASDDPAVLQSHDPSWLTAERARYLMTEQNRQFVLADTAHAAYRRMLEIILDPANGVIDQHCRGGKDRTGFGAALIQLLLGVDRETVVEDYLLTNVCKHEKNERSLNELWEKTHDEDLVQAVRHLKEAERPFIEAALTTLESEYGDAPNFARTALGLSAGDLADLKALYLV